MKPKRAKHSPDLDALCAADVMQRDLVTVQASDPIEEVARTISEAHVGGVPVIGDTGHIVGILSTRDLVKRYADANAEPGEAVFGATDEEGDEEIVDYEPDGSELCAADVMSPDIASVPSTTPLREVARRMVEGEVHRLLVVDDGRLVGLVSTLDILRAIAN
jgi:CBS domain-containing protein